MSDNTTSHNPLSKMKMLNHVESVSKGAQADGWMNDLAVHILSVMTHIENEKDLYGPDFPHDRLLYDILNQASHEIGIHYEIDRKTGVVRAHTLGCV